MSAEKRGDPSGSDPYSLALCVKWEGLTPILDSFEDIEVTFPPPPDWTAPPLPPLPPPAAAITGGRRLGRHSCGPPVFST